MNGYGFKNGKVDWPKNPKEGQEFSYICPISGACWVNYLYFMGTWQFVSRE